MYGALTNPNACTWRRRLIAWLGWLCACLGPLATGAEPTSTVLSPRLRLTNSAAADQDDMAFWIDPTDSSRSTVVTSDKEAGKLFVYDLQGTVLQSVDVQHPGNVDVRQDVAWNGIQRSIVCVNERSAFRLAVFEFDARSRQLTRLDDNDIATAENYGGTLLSLGGQSRLFSLCTSKESGLQQFELRPTEQGRVTGRLIRHWPLGTCEGAVADDQTGEVYVSVEQQGIYRLDAATGNSIGPRLVVPLGKGGLVGDAEGLELVRRDDQRSYLIVSDQGADAFRIYQREPDFAYVGAFTVEGVTGTDGIAITQKALDGPFPFGAFACHTDADDGKSVLVSDAAPIWRLIDDQAKLRRSDPQRESP